MIYLNAFIFCGLVCLIGQIILDNTKLSAGHITSLFVVIGAFLDTFSIYDWLIKNVGMTPARYNLSLMVKESVAASDGRTLDDTLRVMVYDNGESTVYAKGNLNSPAPISVSEGEATEEYPFEGYATNFASSKEIMGQSGVSLNVGEVRRYTIVTWLEGFRSSSLQTAPKGATIKLGVEINAYENE